MKHICEIKKKKTIQILQTETVTNINFKQGLL